ncbi:MULTISPECIES: TniQ family protein [unclassified Shinella]|uniref:TniQ family protein n=1 Tax=unclassified Shinella TaxID=2643062 RepID=UPI00234F6368|nr:TniQ family protein [Shinella sp. YE25]CAK7261620.1 protein of unknown function [Shinella sp. WSC3-e]
MSRFTSAGLPPSRLPVCFKPHRDELLSSWIGRHADFYAVPSLVMLRHCLPEAASLRAADLNLAENQEVRLANMFAAEQADIHRMTFTNVPPSFHSMDRREAVTALHNLQSCPCGAPTRAAKPAAGLADHMLSLWRPPTRPRWARSPLSFPALS